MASFVDRAVVGPWSDPFAGNTAPGGQAANYYGPASINPSEPRLVESSSSRARRILSAMRLSSAQWLSLTFWGGVAQLRAAAPTDVSQWGPGALSADISTFARANPGWIPTAQYASNVSGIRGRRMKPSGQAADDGEDAFFPTDNLNGTETQAERAAAERASTQLIAGLGVINSLITTGGQIAIAQIRAGNIVERERIRAAAGQALQELQRREEAGTISPDRAARDRELIEMVQAQANASEENTRNMLLYAGLGVLGLAVLGGGAYLLTRGGRSRSNPASAVVAAVTEGFRYNPVIGRGMRSSGEAKRWITPAQARRRKARRRAGK